MKQIICLLLCHFMSDPANSEILTKSQSPFDEIELHDMAVEDISMDGFRLTSVLMTQSQGLSYCRQMTRENLLAVDGSDENERVFQFLSTLNHVGLVWTSGTPYNFWELTKYQWMSTLVMVYFSSFDTENPEENMTELEWARMGIALNVSSYGWVLQDRSTHLYAICEIRH